MKKLLLLLLFIPLVSLGQTYKVKRNYDGSYEVKDSKAGQKALIQGAANMYKSKNLQIRTQQTTPSYNQYFNNYYYYHLPRERKGKILRNACDVCGKIISYNVGTGSYNLHQIISEHQYKETLSKMKEYNELVNLGIMPSSEYNRLVKLFNNKEYRYIYSYKKWKN